MTVYVSRGGENIAASVLYNFRKACNVVVLRLHKTFFSDQDDLVLLYDEKEKRWTEMSHLEESEPLFFEQIIMKLRDILSEAENGIKKPDYTNNEKAQVTFNYSL
jgi:hypothetical protein